MRESAGASALPAGASTDGAASSSDAAILADAPALDKSNADLLKKLIDADLLRKAASSGRSARAGLLSKPPPPAML